MIIKNGVVYFSAVALTFYNNNNNNTNDDDNNNNSFGDISLSRNSKGFNPSEGVKREWGRENWHFQLLSRRISDTVKGRTKVTTND